MPYRRQLIVGLVLLAAVTFAGARWSERSEPSPRFTLTPEMVEAIQEQASNPAARAALGRMPEVDPAKVKRLGPALPRPSPTRFLDVTLDAAGRPYDVAIERGARIERRPLAVVHAPSRRVLFLGGESVAYVETGEYDPVLLAERPGRRYPVHAIWIDYPADRKDRTDSIVGAVVVERDTKVVRWRQLRRVAYGTDGGLGGITTVEWAAKDKELDNVVQRRWEQAFTSGRQSLAVDADGHEGVDTIAFANGFGDGGFPSIAGYDAAGRRARIVLWTIVAPWRLSFPDGAAPRRVHERENALAACLAGHRLIDGARCRVAR